MNKETKKQHHIFQHLNSKRQICLFLFFFNARDGIALKRVRLSPNTTPRRTDTYCWEGASYVGRFLRPPPLFPPISSGEQTCVEVRLSLSVSLSLHKPRLSILHIAHTDFELARKGYAPMGGATSNHRVPSRLRWPTFGTPNLPCYISQPPTHT